MRIITETKLRDFWLDSDPSEGIRRQKAMREWISVVKRAEWSGFIDIRATFNHCDTYCNCTIFDVGGNKYRIIAKVAFGIKVVFIRYVFTHREYDEIDWQSDCL